MAFLGRRILRTHIWLILFGTALLGCSEKPKPQPVLPESESQPEAKTVIADPEDRSLTAEEYIRHGLPAPDRLWSSIDMAKASKTLSAIAQNDPRQLPRYLSKNSENVFARITDAQNLSFFQDRTLPLEARLTQALNYLQSTNQIGKLYVAAFLKKVIGGSESLEILGAQCRMAVVLLNLFDELLPTLRKDDSKYPVRMAGVQQMKQGLATMVSGGLLALTETDFYRSTDLVRFIGYMTETFPVIVPQLLPGSRSETLLRLEEMATDERFQSLQPALGRLHVAVRDACKKEKVP